MTVSLGNGVDIGNLVTAETNPLTGGIEIPGIIDGIVISPSGDISGETDLANINAAISKSGRITLMAGAYYINGTINLNPVSLTSDRWDPHGVGLSFYGSGAGVTVIKYVGPSNIPAMLISPGDDLGRRTYLSNVGRFSLICANTDGSNLAQGVTRGSGVKIRTSDGVGFTVYHTNKWENVIFDGFDYPMSMNDTTLLKMTQCWFVEALVGMRIGYNVDLVQLDQCMFGSEDYPSHRTWTGIQNGWDADGFATPGNTDNLVLNQVWCRDIGCAVDFTVGSAAENNISFRDSYFERVDQHLKCGSQQIFLSIDGHNVTGANYSNATTGIFEIKSNSGTVTVKNMHGESVNPPSKSWFYFKTNGVRIHWESNDLPATQDSSPIGGVAGHIVQSNEVASITGSIAGTALSITSVESGVVAIGQYLVGPGIANGTTITAGSGLSWTISASHTVASASMICSTVQQSRFLPYRGRGVYRFGGNAPSATAISKLGGDDIYISLGTIGSGNQTITLDTRIADFFECTLPDNGTASVVTFQLPAGGDNAPFPTNGQRLKLMVQASASTPANTTIAFSGYLSPPASIAQPSTANARTMFEWVCVSSGRWLPVTSPNSWV